MATSPSSNARKPRVWRHFAVLGVALAIPAMALPLSDMTGEEAQDAAFAMTLASERPEENFPGSAFYFLEDAPEYVEERQTAANEASMAPEPVATALAQPFRLIGSDRDHARAQRCMTMALHYEASGESESGKRAVAQVVLNRVRHPAFPSTVCGVVFQGAERSTGCQFSFSCDGAMARRAQAGFSGTHARIAREALAGAVYAPVGLATHFHTQDIYPYWAPSLTNVTTVGAHVFYRWPGAHGQADAFSQRYGGNEPAPGVASNSPVAGPAPVFPAPAMTLPLPSAPVASAPAPVLQPREQTPALPSSGQVREEYAQSGQWIAQP